MVDALIKMWYNCDHKAYILRAKWTTKQIKLVKTVKDQEQDNSTSRNEHQLVEHNITEAGRGVLPFNL